MATTPKTGSKPTLSIFQTNEWEELRSAFLEQCRGDRMKESSIEYYSCRTELFTRWATERGLTLAEFRGRHMTTYISERRDAPGRGGKGVVSFATLTHDGKAVRRLFRFAVEAEFLDADPLKDYIVRKAPAGNVYCPSEEEVRKLLQTVRARWDPARNEKAGFVPAAERRFYCALHYAIVGGLVACAMRINEILALKLEDYQEDRLQIYIAAAKNDEDRYVPFREGWRDVVSEWRKVRPKTKCPNLFVNQFGGPIHPDSFGIIFRRYRELAGLEKVTLHSLRHYAISQLAKVDVLMAANAAGHRSLSVTRKYIHNDADHIREKYDEADPLGKVLVNRRSEQQKIAKRRKIIGK